MDFEIPADIQSTLDTLDAFIEREITPLEEADDNARFFDDREQAVPRHVVTQGLGTILEARHLVLVACGANKAAPIARAVEGPLTAMCPASILQLHPHATVVIDEPAAVQLELAGYYREAFEHKPAWQQL